MRLIGRPVLDLVARGGRLESRSGLSALLLSSDLPRQRTKRQSLGGERRRVDHHLAELGEPPRIDERRHPEAE